MCEPRVAGGIDAAHTRRDTAERHRNIAYARAARSRRCHRLRMSYIIMCRVAAPQNARTCPCSNAAMRLNLGDGATQPMASAATRASHIGYVPTPLRGVLAAARHPLNLHLRWHDISHATDAGHRDRGVPLSRSPRGRANRDFNDHLLQNVGGHIFI